MSDSPLPSDTRELDALVAEKIFGAAWNPVPTKEESGLDFREVAWLQKSPLAVSDRVTITPILARREADGGITVLLDCPHYSTDISDAWKVVERVSGFDKNRSEPWWSVAVFYAQKHQVGCRVYACPPGYSIFDDSSRAIIAEEVADTAPLAICKAALAALRSASGTTTEGGEG